MVGLRDVAARTGVSVMTVSNVVNNRRDKVSAQTFERVQAAIHELDYVPNAQARSLSAGRTCMVGMIVRRPPEDGAALRNPHDALLVDAVERELSEGGLSFVYAARDDVVQAAREMASWQIDGLLVYGSVAEEVDALGRLTSKPIVFLDNHSASAAVEIVGVDDHHGGVLLGRHLGELGHRSILFAGPVHERRGVVGTRLAGLRQGVAEGTGAEPEITTLDVGADSTAVTAVVDEVVRHPGRFTAVVAFGDLLGVPLVGALADAGVVVPDEVSVASFDDQEHCTWVRPRLTSVGQDAAAKGRLAVRRLRGLIEDPQQPHEAVQRLPMELSVRESTGPRRSGRTDP
ncbi:MULTISPECIES: LacI family DNA-binding transcriptional regulator [unclassified Brachybacterium]|uniref:LacI family DNA-binding transcriptional regulator n=1 Tax=unclassified Brachybacterium TaxID=2623841 RepID=UPI000C802CEB|nr:LacI family DNA-binding transcriptional regulator [Brachybacterium sp. UMB0905]PMC75938.1 hypothetical protein CJ197_04510 [Brachybacterium sp. UMB0905]